MNLERYRVPSAIWEGEWIELPDSDGARFLVKLPSPANREWQREMLQLMVGSGVKLDALGEVDTSDVDTQSLMAYTRKRLEVFARLCVVAGPAEFDLASLTGEYWPALQKLWELADARVTAQAEEAQTAVGES